MNKEDEIRESLEFCKDIYVYYENEDANEIVFAPYDKKKERIDGEKEPVSFTERYVEAKRVEQEEDAREEEGKRNFYRTELMPVILCMVAAFIAAKILSMYVVQITVVHGDSMEATVSNGDKLIVGKLNYDFAAPERYDVLVFQKKEDENLIKRVIGLPGEKVEIKKGNIYINDRELVEEYGLDPINREAEPVELKLGEDEYFVLGDNRLKSLDSRYPAIGPVHRKEIIGKVLLRVFPLQKKHIILKDKSGSYKK